MLISQLMENMSILGDKIHTSNAIVHIPAMSSIHMAHTWHKPPLAALLLHLMIDMRYSDLMQNRS